MKIVNTPSAPSEDILSDSLLRVLLSSLGCRRVLASMRDPWLWGLFLAGVIGLFLSPQSAGLSLPALLMAALLEEAAFRALLQNYAEAWLAQKKKGEANEKKCPRHYLLSIVTPGNLAVSLLFAVVHALTQSPLMAALTFFPSLAMGILWTRHRSLWLCTGLHAWYNALFWW